MSDLTSDEDDKLHNTSGPPISKKRKKYGREVDANKILRLQCREQGDPCKCKNKCFEVVNENERSSVLRHMNSLKSHDEVNLYLTGLVTAIPIQRRRVANECEAKFRDTSYSYNVRVLRDSIPTEVKVCKAAFISIHGTTRGKVDYILEQMKHTGTPPQYRKGKHQNRPRKLTDDVTECVRNHIKSFKGRESHYSKKESTKTYLSEDLNVKRMYELFKEKNPDIVLSVESYRTIFNRDFNISFGYPRTDTCSRCDSYAVQKKSLNSQIGDEKCEVKKCQLQKDLKQIEIEHELHLAKAKTFYDRKRAAKKRSRVTNFKEAICIDYAKNFPCPNVTSNDVYYKRQLSFYAFNAHILSNGKSVFYTYPETIAHKGSDEVASFIHHFVYNHLDENVTHLEIFADSCSGQNKNKTVLRLMHHLVHIEKKLKFVKMTFPIRGHSYLECDKNTAIINHKAPAETPGDWAEVFRSSRSKPSSFVVEEVTQDMIRGWSVYLDEKYKSKKLPFASRSVREFMVEKEHPILLKYRLSYNGGWYETPISKTAKKKQAKKNNKIIANQSTREQNGTSTQPRTNQPNEHELEFTLPETVYEGKDSVCTVKCILFWPNTRLITNRRLENILYKQNIHTVFCL